MARPVPEQPADCRRENTRRFLISILPATACVIFSLLGYWTAVLVVFSITFVIICYGTILPSSRLFGDHVSMLPPEQASRGQIWITVDDGPDPLTTPKLLDLLDAAQAKAGFFLIGDKAAQYPELVREIVRRGHLVGNHSQTHPAGLFWSLRPTKMWAEVAGCQQTLTDILGVPPVWFRPPVGHHNVFLFPPLKVLGLTMIMWNCRGFDGVVKDAAFILKLIAKGLKPGAIVLLHDGTSTCVEVMQGTLHLLSERGLQAALPESLHLTSPTPSLVKS